jgi:hypothetical protein
MTTIAKARSHLFAASDITEEDGMFRVDSTGIYAAGFEEKPALPDNCYYFPLDSSALGYAPTDDEFRSLSPASASNVVFDENGCWVGSATTNLWPQRTGSWGWNGGTIASSATGFMFVGTKHKLTQTNQLQSTASSSNTFSSSISAYTVSCYYKQSSGTATTPTGFRLLKTYGGLEFTGRTNEELYIPTIKVSMQRGWGTAVYPTASTGATPYVKLFGSSAIVVDTTAMMITATPFVAPYCTTTRDASVLTFNLHESLELNWNEDWTIMYWKRPHGSTAPTGTDALNGLSQDSLGSSDNTVGGGYSWWGKGTGLAYGMSGVGATISVRSAYQYNWHFHVIRQEGTTRSLQVYGVGTNDAFLLQSEEVIVPTADYYVTQNGYDLQLGGHDYGNASNTYYRDLMVVKYAISDEDIRKLYMTKMKLSSSHELQVANLTEGEI